MWPRTSFNALPSESIARILELTDPLDIRRCQQASSPQSTVCRWLRDLVADDQYLQYMLELDVCDYVVPPNPRLDLSYAEKVRALREHRARWQQPGLVKPIFIPHPQGTINETYFVDGTFACGLASSSPSTTWARARIIHFDRLPSWNRGTEHTHWHHDLGFDAVCFVIHPEQDMLVALEEVANEVSTEPFPVPGTLEANEHFRVHLRTMSTNEPHPIVTSPFSAMLDLDFGAHNAIFGRENRSYQMQIYGRLVAVVFETRMSVSRRQPAKLRISIKIIDWAVGSEVSNIEATFQGSNRCSFGFLSEEYFIVARSADAQSSPAPGSHVLSPLGYLDIYHISSSSHESLPVKACCVVSLLLPDLQTNQITSLMELRCAPARTTPALLSTQIKRPAEIFQSATGNELLAINISLSTLDRNIRHGYGYVVESSAGTLYLPTHVLGGILSESFRGSACTTGQGSHSNIPWNAWGHRLYGNWFNGSFTFPRPSDICGQRLVTVQTSEAVDQANDSKVQLVISDFSSNRMRARQAVCTDGKAPFRSDIPDDKEPNMEEHEWESNRSPSGIAHEPPPCIETRFEVERDGEGGHGAVKATLIDDEHVLIRVARGHDGGSSGIYVYTL